MRRLRFSRPGCFAVLMLACLGAAAATPPGNVQVHYRDPQQFTEAKRSVGVHARDADEYLKPLKDYITQRAARILAPGQRLDIVVTDVDRAGEYEPWHGPDFHDIRIIKDVYPPRIDLDFTLYGADGEVLRQGSRKLRDAAFLDRGTTTGEGSLRYEKALVDRWLRKGAGQL